MDYTPPRFAQAMQTNTYIGRDHGFEIRSSTYNDPNHATGDNVMHAKQCRLDYAICFPMTRLAMCPIEMFEARTKTKPDDSSGRSSG